MNKVKTSILIMAFAVIGLSAPPPVVASVQLCCEPYCGLNNSCTKGGLLKALGNRLNHGSLNRPRGLRNPALLNLGSGSAPSGIDFSSAFQIGGSYITQIGGTAVDSDGNFYITGGFTGSIELGNKLITSSMGYDFYLVKYDPDGNFLWARTASGMANIYENLAIEGGIAISVDGAGNCYVGGAFVQSMSFKDGNGDVVKQLTDGRNDGQINFEMFVAKYSTSGNLLWARGGNSGSSGGANFLGTDGNVVTSLILDSEDYPYIGGRYSGSDFLGESVSPRGKSDFFVASLKKDSGDPFWVSMSGTPDDDAVLSLSVDSLGYINVLGEIGEGIFSLPDISDTTGVYTNDTGSSDTFIMSYDINGEWYFVSLIGGGENITGNDVASDPDGNIYVTGDFSGTAGFVESDITVTSNGEAVNGYIVKYDLNGNTLWARKFGGQTFAKGSRIVVDEKGSSYIVGMFAENAVFGEGGSNSIELSANALTDMFVAKYDTDGNFEWVKQIDGSGTEGLDLITSGEVPVGTNPIQLLYNAGELIVSGDFNDMLFLDNIELDSGVKSRSGFVASLNVGDPSTGVAGNASGVITEFALQQNYPNPFNPATTFNFELPQAENVTIDIFNSLGQKIETLVNERMASGSHEVVWTASGQPSGSYFYTIKAGQYSETKKMILLK